jgi:hypothetical protein
MEQTCENGSMMRRPLAVREKKQVSTPSERRGSAGEKVAQTGADAVKRQLADHLVKVWDHPAIGIYPSRTSASHCHSFTSSTSDRMGAV